MKRQTVTEEKQPGYPALNDHVTKRRGLVKTVLGGMLALLAAGCNIHPRTAGVMVAPCTPEEGSASVSTANPTTPNNLPLEPPVMLDGDIAFPTPPEPEEPPPTIKGKMVAPAKPPTPTK